MTDLGSSVTPYSQNQLSIHVTDLCNSACEFCVVGSPFYKQDTILIADLMRFISENARGDFPVVNLHGGEPTIFKHLMVLLDHILHEGYSEIIIQTNAVKLAASGFVQDLISRRARTFIVSIHGHTAALHDHQTQHKGGFEKTLAGIVNAVEFGARVQTNTVLTQSNVSHLSDIVLQCAEIGVQHMNFSNLHPVGSAALSTFRIMPRFEDLLPLLDEAIEQAIASGMTVSLEGFPLCIAGNRQNLHLQSRQRKIKMLMRGQVIEDYDAFMQATQNSYDSECELCVLRANCGGIYPAYATRYGRSPLIRAVTG